MRDAPFDALSVGRGLSGMWGMRERPRLRRRGPNGASRMSRVGLGLTAGTWRGAGAGLPAQGGSPIMHSLTIEPRVGDRGMWRMWGVRDLPRSRRRRSVGRLCMPGAPRSGPGGSPHPSSRCPPFKNAPAESQPSRGPRSPRRAWMPCGTAPWMPSGARPITALRCERDARRGAGVECHVRGQAARLSERAGFVPADVFLV